MLNVFPGRLSHLQVAYRNVLTTYESQFFLIKLFWIEHFEYYIEKEAHHFFSVVYFILLYSINCQVLVLES